MLNMNFPETKPIEIYYRNYKHFDEVSLKKDTKTTVFNNTDTQTCESFEKLL